MKESSGTGRSHVLTGPLMVCVTLRDSAVLSECRVLYLTSDVEYLVIIITHLIITLQVIKQIIDEIKSIKCMK